MRFFTSSVLVSIIILLSIKFNVFAKTPHLKHEYRAVVLATAWALDWPPDASSDIQKNTLRDIIHTCKEIGLNTIAFQVVAQGNAMYKSDRLPWAPWLTGEPGKDPGWDPLEYLIKEAHALGMEVHAGFNVFRVGNSTPRSKTHEPLHVIDAYPEWVETVDGNYYINPGYPDARKWIIENVLEIVENYEIDGIRFDYLRYPSGGFPEDWQLFREYNPNEKDNLNDWRRDNINEFVRDVYPAIKDIKPWMKVGSTPIGHYYSPNYPAFSGYEHAFQDSRRWLEEEVHDYLTPQLYFDIEDSDDTAQFELLTREWIDETPDRHIYIGMGPYKPNVYPEIPAQIDTVREAGGDGQIYFRYSHITPPPPFGDRYQYPSLPPVMDYNDITVPDPIVTFSFDRHPEMPVSVLQWEEPEETPEGGIRSYVLYRFDDPNITEEDLDDPANIYDVMGETQYSPEPDEAWGTNFVVTGLSQNNVESTMSQVVEIPHPHAPALSAPVDESPSESDTIRLVWSFADYASRYYVEVAEGEGFSEIIYSEDALQDTTIEVTGLEGQQWYYWRTKTSNAAGESGYSEQFSFKTGFPATPLLVYPEHGTEDVPVTPELTWYADESAGEYRVQVATGRGFGEAVTVFDSTGITDTTVVVPEELKGGEIHYWRVSGTNEYGTSLWSDTWGFRTEVPVFVDEDKELPEEFVLQQNYPNPFNPVTTIEFSVPQEEHVTLKVYDILGREVAVLFNERAISGNYRVEFDASSFPTGVYLYNINAETFTETKCMIYVR